MDRYVRLRAINQNCSGIGFIMQHNRSGYNTGYNVYCYLVKTVVEYLQINR